ncbi:IS630 transposase-related protein [Candidatus Fukatsuia symbiotica]|uniref:Transposase n=1 Tax=Candidatus Fukatsuia symbiotica TaxID=1878942 RepID=A0A2U8I4W0_9GAMM|nr:IS630 transposase-related protein [Candidatus Fukatsuia symbiotica]AWK14200.1 transposase [Candidatus Fukatsuia symbiotica]AWK15011.1 transposase [Candidatus Fukatsuia symbiotica]MEA9443807.1 IS630 transposase-related protein [Candidatus Fukatsuia symbiotica]MEA9446304.1 IS630 transposase-related protein [Candidatus Fukatsuia symbiotica]
MSHSVDFRRKVLSIREKENLSIRETAKRFHIGSASVTRWLSRIEVKPSSPRRRKLDKVALAEDVALYPDAYQRERAARFQVCQKAIWQALKNLGVTYKKNPASSQGRRRDTARLPGHDSLL